MDRRECLIKGFALVGGIAGACRRTTDRAADAGTPGAPGPRRRFDAHLHLPPRLPFAWDDFLQVAQIESGLNLSGGWPGGLLEASLEAAGGRWLVATSLPWHFAAHPRFPEAAAEGVERAAELGARALKIEKALGLSARRPDGELWAIDAPELDPIFDAAGAAELPVFIHSADPRAFWAPNTPDNPRHAELEAHPAWSYADRPVPGFARLWDAFAARVARHPKTRFVGVHFGNRAEDPPIVSALMDRQPNLYIDLAARLPELGKHPPDVLRPIFARHRDRILFGTDFGVMGPEAFMLGSTGETPDRWADVPPFYARSYAYLEREGSVPSMTPIQGTHDLAGLGLPPDITKRIYWDNAERLLGPLPRPA
jgi:predicted TIM-barrel fold metal-dependent hydrolase